MRSIVLACVFGLWASAPAYAKDSIVGVWQTEPDRKELTSHIEVAPCGAGYCGRVLRAFDPTGAEVTTRNIGRMLFWDMKPQDNGTFGGGAAYVPILNVTTSNVALTLSGERLEVKGRVGLMRGTQVWTRLR
ncbi:DUF2147 domain-containing protein [Thalassobacter stenotrophicus]|uniref:DUF2147 domain-containing protein n=2 Tax=Thalassobacter stenotrophicus TaxID=266809 RepID=A0A0P1F1A6_9RHOB|nr:DUF2147 domain-containing protein [Thalassobacter stenotrophicus]PVZ48546.1 DUF2147 domain-containing protein [Thalassobacter stenotrophicus]CUH61365.1 hypothetical protein THS5294_02671 [Thalassobacter stenotrophicus]SHI63702.1 Uncharacterized conserved protein, DUF2147 family [Thalassobacter stenotrophicus DSM 16310]